MIMSIEDREAHEAALEVITAAKARMERGWTQGANARDKDGREVRREDPEATCWCLSAAIWMSAEETGNYNDPCTELLHSKLNAHSVALGFSNFVKMNDAAKSRDQVFYVVDNVIRELENETPKATSQPA